MITTKMLVQNRNKTSYIQIQTHGVTVYGVLVVVAEVFTLVDVSVVVVVVVVFITAVVVLGVVVAYVIVVVV